MGERPIAGGVFRTRVKGSEERISRRHFPPVSTSWTGTSYRISMYIASRRRDTWWHRSPETTKVVRAVVLLSHAPSRPARFGVLNTRPSPGPASTVWERGINASPRNFTRGDVPSQIPSEKCENCILNTLVRIWCRHVLIPQGFYEMLGIAYCAGCLATTRVKNTEFAPIGNN